VVSLLSPGARITDTLVVDRLLGEGAFAEVHRVRHDFLGWQAMKVFKRVGSLGETRGMLDEARLLSTIGHPNIVRVFDASLVSTPEGKRGFFTMEYVAGGSLEKLAEAQLDAVPVDTVVEAVVQIASGLAVAHEQDPPIIHRDLTPANVLVGYDAPGMRLRISDFGLARRADPGSQRARGSDAFTLAFTPPEVLLRRESYTRAGDVWSIGTIAYLLLTNHLPYKPRTPDEWRSAVRFRDPLPPPSNFNDDVDAALDRLVLNCLELAAADRPASAAEVAHAFLTRQSPDRARQLATEALALARHPGTLAQAADLMQEAVTLSPQLRDLYQSKLSMWQRGVMM
jgi:serine/threonine-protein kinase